MKNHKKAVFILTIALSILVAAVIFLWVRYGQRAERYQCTNSAMGTNIEQTVYGRNAQKAATAAAQNIGELDSLISWQNEGSDTDRLNQATGTNWVSIDAKTAKLLQTCLGVASDSGGAFDPTILPIASLWDFGGNNQRVPSETDIQKYLPYIGYQNLRVNTAQNSASLRNHFMGLDLDAVEKGAACDEAIAAYRTSGADCGIVAAGESIGTYGKKADGSVWSIAVRDPSSSSDSVAAMGEIGLTSGFVSTLATNENSFRANGILYSPPLNPKTGRPQNNGLVSVTVVSNGGALSDALADACFVLGREKSTSLLKKYDAGAIWIDSANRIYTSENLKTKFTVTNRKYILQS